MLIAKNKKSHNIGESLVKPCILVAAELVLGKDKANMLSQIALSNDTVKERIDKLSQNIKDQLLDQIKESPFFAIQCDETTGIGSCSQILLYARFLSINTIKEEMLFYNQRKVVQHSRNFYCCGKLFSGKPTIMGIISRSVQGWSSSYDWSEVRLY